MLSHLVETRNPLYDIVIRYATRGKCSYPLVLRRCPRSDILSFPPTAMMFPGPMFLCTNTAQWSINACVSFRLTPCPHLPASHRPLLGSNNQMSPGATLCRTVKCPSQRRRSGTGSEGVTGAVGLHPGSVEGGDPSYQQNLTESVIDFALPREGAGVPPYVESQRLS